MGNKFFTFRRVGLIERWVGRGHSRTIKWFDGWAWYNGGNLCYPWMLQQEAREWAKQQGGVAIFDHTPVKEAP